MVKHPTFKICQDLESRLGIEQGYVRQTDYRDELLSILNQYKSRYQFCKIAGISETFLSHILSKRKNISIIRLAEMLDKVGYEIAFIKKHKSIDDKVHETHLYGDPNELQNSMKNR